MEIKVTIDEALEINISHDMAPNAEYCYGAAEKLEDVPNLVACALDEIVAELRGIESLDPDEEVTEETVHKLWIARQDAATKEEGPNPLDNAEAIDDAAYRRRHYQQQSPGEG